MARIRSLHPGQSSDEDFVALSMEARVFCLLLRCHADDQGVFEWKPKSLKMKIFPADNIDVIPLLDELQDNRQVKQFEVDGRIYGAIRNFRQWQRPKKPSAVYPLPPDIRTYVALNGKSSPPVENHDDTEEEIPPQREEGGDVRKEEGDSSEDKSSGAAAPPPAEDVSRETDPWKAIYAGFKKHLGTKAGGMISKLRQCSGEPEMANWLADLEAGRIADPREYFGKIISARDGNPPARERSDPELAFKQRAGMVARGIRSKEPYTQDELTRMVDDGLVTTKQADVFGWKDPNMGDFKRGPQAA